MRIVMMGTGPFAAPTFQALAKSPLEVVALVTRSTAPPHKGRKTPINPMREVAQRLAVPVFDPPDINQASAQEMLVQLRADLYVVCDYGQILSAATLATSKLGGVNLHGSLLPKYRGAAPINWALLEGETRTGVTVIHMTPQLDGGPCLARRETEIGDAESAMELEERLSHLGVEPVLEAIAMLERWDGRSPLGDSQPSQLVSKAPRLKKSDGNLDWSWPARRIANHVRAMKPWPGSFTNWRRPDKPPMRIIINQASVAAGAAPDMVPADSGDGCRDQNAPQRWDPGRVVRSDGQRLWIACGDHSAVALEYLQPAGKRSMQIAEFLRGHDVRVGDRFGDL